MLSPFLWLSVASAVFYLAGTYLALRDFQANQPTNRMIRAFFDVSAVALHGAAERGGLDGGGCADGEQEQVLAALAPDAAHQ